MSTATILIGPDDHGRTMTLDEFEQADFVSGYVYELGRGVIVVNDVPNLPHGAIVDAIRQQLSEYRGNRRGEIRYIFGGAECRILVERLQSERHPDLAVYKTEAPGRDSSIWAEWVPDLLIEVISPGSRSRDVDDKPEEYFQFGIKEYWIVDSDDERLIVLRRSRGRWRRHDVVSPGTWQTHLLPGFVLQVEPVFAAGRDAGATPGE